MNIGLGNGQYRQATSHYQKQCWSTLMTPYGVTMTQYVKTICWTFCTFCWTNINIQEMLFCYGDRWSGFFFDGSYCASWNAWDAFKQITFYERNVCKMFLFLKHTFVSCLSLCDVTWTPEHSVRYDKAQAPLSPSNWSALYPRSRLASHELNIPQGQQRTAGVRDGR